MNLFETDKTSDLLLMHSVKYTACNKTSFLFTGSAYSSISLCTDNQKSFLTLSTALPAAHTVNSLNTTPS